MDNISLGISLTIVGIGTVFVVLILLQVTMNAEARLLNYYSNRPTREKQNNPTNTPEVVPIPAAYTNTTNKEGELSPVSSTDQTLPPQLIAAIMGAITCYRGQPSQTLRIVSVRKTWDRQASSAWSFQGRTHLINSRSSFYDKGGSK